MQRTYWERINILISFRLYVTGFHISYLLCWEVEFTLPHTASVCWRRWLSTLLQRGAALGICSLAERQNLRVSGWSSKVSPPVYGSFRCWQVWINVHHEDPPSRCPRLCLLQPRLLSQPNHFLPQNPALLSSCFVLFVGFCPWHNKSKKQIHAYSPEYPNMLTFSKSICLSTKRFN